jgi:hypothetical protein
LVLHGLTAPHKAWMAGRGLRPWALIHKNVGHRCQTLWAAAPNELGISPSLLDISKLAGQNSMARMIAL